MTRRDTGMHNARMESNINDQEPVNARFVFFFFWTDLPNIPTIEVRGPLGIEAAAPGIPEA